MKKGLVAAALVLLVLPVFCRAETMYITDRIEASLSSGKGLSAGSQFLKRLSTGDKVDVLRTEGDYARIVDASGMEGWLHRRYLAEIQPAANDVLKEKIKAGQAELARLEGLRAAQDAKIREAEKAYKSLKAGCADFINSRSEIEKAQKELQASQEVVVQLKQENDDLLQNNQLMWFIFGAAAVLCGFIIGMWLQSLRKRRKSKYSL